MTDTIRFGSAQTLELPAWIPTVIKLKLIGAKHYAIWVNFYLVQRLSIPKGFSISAEATVLYALANLYSKTDINKAKVCAKILLKNFPKSDYNNNVMKALLSK